MYVLKIWLVITNSFGNICVILLKIYK